MESVWKIGQNALPTAARGKLLSKTQGFPVSASSFNDKFFDDFFDELNVFLSKHLIAAPRQGPLEFK